MIDKLQQIEDRFRERRSVYESFTSNLTRLLETLFDVGGAEYIQIESRTKTQESLSGKLSRQDKAEKYRNLEDITDLCGVRVVTYYERDVGDICKIIEENFDIDAENSTDKRKSIDNDRFGYISMHYVVKLNRIRHRLPENANFANLKAEIQVRTVLQHAWAVLDRRLRYNTKAEIPNEIKRKLFLVSAKLEDADNNLTEIEKRVLNLRNEYAEEVKAGELVSEINRDSIEVFVQGSPLVDAIWALAHKSRMAGEVVDADETVTIGHFIKLLQAVGIGNMKELNRFIIGTMDKVENVFTAFAQETAKMGITKRFTKYGILRLLFCLSADRETSAVAIRKTNYRDDTMRIVAETLKRIRK